MDRDGINIRLTSAQMERIISDCIEGEHGTKEDLLFLYLLKNNTLRDRYIVPGLFTQHGLQSVLDCDQSYISRLLRKNEREGLISRRMLKIENRKQRQNAFFLTEEGIRFALTLVKNISKSSTIK